MNDKWWGFWDTKEHMLGGVEFVVRCQGCGEYFAIDNLINLPDECPDCKRKNEVKS